MLPKLRLCTSFTLCAAFGVNSALTMRGHFAIIFCCWFSIRTVYSQIPFGNNANPVGANINTVTNSSAQFVVAGPAKAQPNEDYLQTALREINKIRSFYGAKPLHLDTELVKGAQTKSDLLATNSSITRDKRDAEAAVNEYYADHDFRTKGQSKSIACTNVINEMYNEADKSKPPKRGKRDLKTSAEYMAAFVQMIWDGTERLGVGVTEIEQYNYIVVMRFSPPTKVDVGEYLASIHPTTPSIPFEKCRVN